MKYRRLGNTGLKVSELCLGTMTFGTGFFGIGQVDQQGANALTKRALDAGINFFDTADIYSRGESETLLGRAIKDAGVHRDDVVIATKVRGPMSDAAGEGTGDVNNVGLSRKHIMASCEASLKRLDTDHIDLYQIHGYDPITPFEETMEALGDLVRQGKVRYIGCSNLTGWQLALANGIAAGRGQSQFCSLQAYYSLLGRELELDLLPLCRDQGIGVMVWSPLAGGFLSGKFRRNQSLPEDSRRSSFDFPPIDREHGYDVVELLHALAAEKGVTVPQLALSWLLQQPGVTTIIVGAKKMTQLEDNLAAVDVDWREPELAQVAKITRLPSLYPYWMIERQRRQ